MARADDNSSSWFTVSQGSRQHALSDVSKVALFVIDMQEAFVAQMFPLARPGALSIVPGIQRLVSELRQAGATIVWTRHTWSDETGLRPPHWFEAMMDEATLEASRQLRPGMPGHEIYAGFDVDPADIVIDKYRLSAFLPDTSALHATLLGKGIDSIIIAGTVTNFCCQSTARDAFMLDYRVLFVADGTAAASEEDQASTLGDLQRMGFFDLPTCDEIRREVAAARLMPTLQGAWASGSDCRRPGEGEDRIDLDPSSQLDPRPD